MTKRIAKDKWVLYRHTKNFKMISVVAEYLKRQNSISESEKAKLLLKLKETGIYKGRNKEMPLDSINHRINTLAYFMFGYKDKVAGENRFLFSPLGNLFLKHLEEKDKIGKIFLTMLWAVQFEHPHDSGMDSTFKIYPFRLIFKLLTESRLGRKLYAYEVAMVLVFLKEISEEGYEMLVEKLLRFRAYSNSDLEKILRGSEHVYVNSAYEWDYYVSDFLQSSGILNKEEGETICRLQHGKTSTYRKITRNATTLRNEVYEYCLKLERQYPYYQKPLALDDPDRLRIDIVKEIYAFFPEILLTEIGEDAKELQDILRLPQLIEKYANNDKGEEAYLFEDILVDGFNTFCNVEAKKIGGAGNTDIECLYITKKKKFAVDAKSTKNKLSQLNAGRLDHHREKIGGEYTIVVTPRYVPAVRKDIKNSKIVIILASTFSEYLYNVLSNDIREVDYADFDSIIVANLGTDISASISQMTFSRFGIGDTQL